LAFVRKLNHLAGEGTTLLKLKEARGACRRSRSGPHFLASYRKINGARLCMPAPHTPFCGYIQGSAQNGAHEPAGVGREFARTATLIQSRARRVGVVMVNPAVGARNRRSATWIQLSGADSCSAALNDSPAQNNLAPDGISSISSPGALVAQAELPF
jgi:hypothetical protein